ncbi:MAG TPA: zinc ABC transporter substrate-binding protein, partial [Ilumatobacteraceae bacterium]|nr:zinc ABC transporter substrate-binding protein [Ilumatobacteraceae bacterium]
MIVRSSTTGSLRRSVAAVAIAATIVTLAACGSDETASDLQVVTTVAPITSIAANVIGDCAEIVGIVPEGTNSHTFEPP